MFKLLMLIAFLSGDPISGNVVEKEVSFGPWNYVQCSLRARRYVEMYDSMPGFVVIRAVCKQVSDGPGWSEPG